MIDPQTDFILRKAIAEKRLLRLRYHDHERIVEPHDYGEKNGSIKLLAYQTGGSSNGPLPNWRFMEVNQLSELQLLDQTFPGGRPTKTGGHHNWDRLFIRVEPAKPATNSNRDQGASTN